MAWLTAPVRETSAERVPQLVRIWNRRRPQLWSLARRNLPARIRVACVRVSWWSGVVGQSSRGSIAKLVNDAAVDRGIALVATVLLNNLALERRVLLLAQGQVGSNGEAEEQERSPCPFSVVEEHWHFDHSQNGLQWCCCEFFRWRRHTFRESSQALFGGRGLALVDLFDPDRKAVVDDDDLAVTQGDALGYELNWGTDRAIQFEDCTFAEAQHFLDRETSPA